MNSESIPAELDRLLEHFQRMAEAAGGLPADDTPAAILMREFQENTWSQCRDEFLRKTAVIRVRPEFAPGIYRFEIDCPYKRKMGPNASVELMPGPVRGRIHYRADMFADPESPYIAVQIDPHLAYFHPNCSRQHGSLLCLGHIPASSFPFPLDLLLQNHIYPIVTYQNRSPADPLDREAAHYFAFAPEAMDGLEPVQPLY